MREESDKTDKVERRVGRSEVERRRKGWYEGGTGSKIGGEVVRGRGDGWRRMDVRG